MHKTAVGRRPFCLSSWSFSRRGISNPPGKWLSLLQNASACCNRNTCPKGRRSRVFRTMEARPVTAARSAVGAGFAAIGRGPSGRLPAQRRRHSSGKGHLNRHNAAKGPLGKFEVLTIKNGLLTGAACAQSWKFRASAKR